MVVEFSENRGTILERARFVVDLIVALHRAILGWLAVVLSGSDASGNALFGNFQVIAATQLKLNPVFFAATNSSGSVMGKMVWPENIATGSSLIEHCADVARTFPHSNILAVVLRAVVAMQQFLPPWVIPHFYAR